MRALLLCFLVAVMVEKSIACSRLDDPCGATQCCYIRYRFFLLLFRPYCVNDNSDSARCGQNDFCSGNADCRDVEGSVCEGFSTYVWGRCTKPVTAKPVCNKKRRLHPKQLIDTKQEMAQ